VPCTFCGAPLNVYNTNSTYTDVTIDHIFSNGLELQEVKVRFACRCYVLINNIYFTFKQIQLHVPKISKHLKFYLLVRMEHKHDKAL